MRLRCSSRTSLMDTASQIRSTEIRTVHCSTPIGKTVDTVRLPSRTLPESYDFSSELRDSQTRFPVTPLLRVSQSRNELTMHGGELTWATRYVCALSACRTEQTAVLGVWRASTFIWENTATPTIASLKILWSRTI